MMRFHASSPAFRISSTPIFDSSPISTTPGMRSRHRWRWMRLVPRHYSNFSSRSNLEIGDPFMRRSLMSILFVGSFLARSLFAQAALNGAGATFPNPIYTKWFDAYAKKTGVKINYQSIGSGGGIRQFSEGTVDFGASDG